jgi:hypothetical protein
MDKNDSCEQVFDASPYLKLQIDKDGRWFQNGKEIINKQVYLQFNQMLENNGCGGYLVRMGREICSVEVQDAPFVIVRTFTGEDGHLCLMLNDDTIEHFSADRFWMTDENIPYTFVKTGSFHARFSRPAYYQLAENIVSDDEVNFFIEMNGSKFPILRSRPTVGNSV